MAFFTANTQWISAFIVLLASITFQYDIISSTGEITGHLSLNYFAHLIIPVILPSTTSAWPPLLGRTVSQNAVHQIDCVLVFTSVNFCLKCLVLSCACCFYGFIFLLLYLFLLPLFTLCQPLSPESGKIFLRLLLTLTSTIALIWLVPLFLFFAKYRFYLCIQKVILLHNFFSHLSNCLPVVFLWMSLIQMHRVIQITTWQFISWDLLLIVKSLPLSVNYVLIWLLLNLTQSFSLRVWQWPETFLTSLSYGPFFPLRESSCPILMWPYFLWVLRAINGVQLQVRSQCLRYSCPSQFTLLVTKWSFVYQV